MESFLEEDIVSSYNLLLVKEKVLARGKIESCALLFWDSSLGQLNRLEVESGEGWLSVYHRSSKMFLDLAINPRAIQMISSFDGEDVVFASRLALGLFLEFLSSSS